MEAEKFRLPSNEVLIKEIRGYIISFNKDSNNTFNVYGEEDENIVLLTSKNSINECVEYIDKREVRLEKEIKKRFEPIICLKKEYYNNRVYEAKITSIADNKYGLYVWCKINENRRKELARGTFLVKNEDNLIKLARIKELEKEIEDLKSNLKYWKEEEIRKHFGEDD